jgi:hypothetical protein
MRLRDAATTQFHILESRGCPSFGYLCTGKLGYYMQSRNWLWAGDQLLLLTVPLLFLLDAATLLHCERIIARHLAGCAGSFTSLQHIRENSIYFPRECKAYDIVLLTEPN